MENEKGIVKLTRKQLYDEIWALSVAGVARKYNLNYGKLIATCKVENISFPSSGYWTKKNMGKDVSNEIVEFSGLEDTEISLITKDAVVKRIRKAKAEVVEKVHTDVTEELDVVTEEDLPQKKTDNIPEWPDGILDYLDETERNKVLEYACNLQISQSTRLHKMLVQYKKDIADYKSKLKEAQSRPYYNPRHNKPENEPAFFKEMSDECMTLASVKAEKSTHYTSPPKMFTEDTLLAAMETAGNKEFDSETEKKGLGTPATRANIIEKLVSSGYAERKGKQILPTVAGCELIHVMPENLKSAGLTAEWENQLLMMEKGEIQEDEFMNGIVSMINEILSMCRAISEEERNRFQIAKEVIGKCPVCGSDVYEGKTNYYCSDRSCQFALWKSNRFLESMKKSMDKKMAVELLKNGRTHVKGLYSKKKDSKFDADLVLGLEDGKARFSLEFPKKKK